MVVSYITAASGLQTFLGSASERLMTAILNPPQTTQTADILALLAPPLSRTALDTDQ